MLILAIILGAVAVAALVKFYPDLQKRSLVTGVRCPVEFAIPRTESSDSPAGVRPLSEYTFYPADLLQHIRETNYVWAELLDGVYIGVLNRGFGHHYAIAWDSAAGTLELTDAQEYVVWRYRWSHLKGESIGQFPQDLRDEIHHEVVHHLRLQPPAATTGGELPLALVRALTRK